MGLLAIIVAQVLDPVRVIGLLVLFGLTRLAENKGTGWFALAVGYLLISIVWPGILNGWTGPLAAMRFVAGFLSNAIILGLAFLVTRLWRR
ncbi:hypothetical protein [Mesorhizobium sp. B2-1-3A]|uniref:hypothetical protein n=1 Tax=Mesorhizobium sp. B2-1-3A TaxID=2589971 RepID=UPI0011273A3E|nr:hypothetical protein [Mesorhizobium sp. B2-1-3A]TPM89866.1 hypothetical protein FJ977_35410 [Mesorhizobium sp. B2-1-3A]